MSNQPFTEKQEQQAVKTMRFMSRVQAWVFKKTGGRLFNTFFFLAPVGILTSKGRKSGQWREACLVYGEIENKVLLIASKAGCSTHPLWYLNLKAHPECKMQLRNRVVEMRAREAEGEEKAALWEKMTTVYKGFNTYRERAGMASGRDVPLMVLEKQAEVKGE